MKNKKMRSLMPAAALLLALTLPPAAYGQSDGFFNNAGGARDGNGNVWNGINGGGNGVAWNGMEDEAPVGGGLLVLMLSGACYAGAKKVKRLKSKD